MQRTSRFRVIAPDLPGFGLTEAPARGTFEYSFGSLADVVGQFVDAIGLTRHALYVFDYGAPVGLRLAMAHHGDRHAERQRLCQRLRRHVGAVARVLA